MKTETSITIFLSILGDEKMFLFVWRRRSCSRRRAFWRFNGVRWNVKMKFARFKSDSNLGSGSRSARGDGDGDGNSLYRTIRSNSLDPSAILPEFLTRVNRLKFRVKAAKGLSRKKGEIHPPWNKFHRNTFHTCLFIVLYFFFFFIFTFWNYYLFPSSSYHSPQILFHPLISYSIDISLAL